MEGNHDGSQEKAEEYHDHDQPHQGEGDHAPHPIVHSPAYVRRRVKVSRAMALLPQDSPRKGDYVRPMQASDGFARVAVVDDEPAIRTLLERELTAAGFDVRTAHDGLVGLELIRKWQPDVILLDVMMPKIDGISILPRYRAVTQAPILILSAKGGTDDKVLGLRNGADQYVAKPFEIPELVARLRSALRRPILDKPERLTHADLTVDLRARSVQRGDRAIELTRREFDLLVTLAREPHRVFTKDQLISRVWGDGAAVTTNAVEAYVSCLRNKIAVPDGERLIATVRGVGYRFL